MATDVTRIGIVVDADGAITALRKTTGELDRLDKQTIYTSNTMRRLWQAEGLVMNASYAMSDAFVAAGQRTRTFATNAGFALSNFASTGVQDITSVMHSLSGLGFVLGGATGGVIALGLSVIADAWSETTRKAKEEQDKQLADFKQFTAKFGEEALRVRIKALEVHRAQLAGMDDSDPAKGKTATAGLTPLQIFGRQFLEIFTGGPGSLASPQAAAIQKINDELAALNRLLPPAVQKSRELADELQKAADAIDAGVAERFTDIILDQEAAEIRSIRATLDAEEKADEEYDDFWRNLILDQEAFEIRSNQERIDKEIEAEKRAAKQKREFWVGAGLGLLQATGPAGGVLAGAIQGGISGSVAGPFGIAFGAINGLVGGILNLGKASREAARATQEFITAQRIYVGDLTQEQVNAQQVADRYAKELEHLGREQQYWAERLREGAITWQQYSAVTDEITRKTETLTDLQKRSAATTAANAAAKEAEIVAINKTMQEDAQVRLLMAQGRTEAAEALKHALDDERELAQARTDGATAATLATIQEAQRAEAIQRSMEKIKATIDSLTGTITGLQDFRNSLLLNDPTLSPTARLAEARRQYEEVLALSKGDDLKKAQEAAGRLPASAQALLDASRAVNASGPGYQTDLQRVLKDNQDLINAFSDKRSVEELMLDELKKIQVNTLVGKRLVEEIITPIGVVGGGTTGGTTGGGTVEVEQMDEVVTVLQAGFTGLYARIESLESGQDELRAAVKTSGEQILTAVQ